MVYVMRRRGPEVGDWFNAPELLAIRVGLALLRDTPEVLARLNIEERIAVTVTHDRVAALLAGLAVVVNAGDPVPHGTGA